MNRFPQICRVGYRVSVPLQSLTFRVEAGDGECKQVVKTTYSTEAGKTQESSGVTCVWESIPCDYRVIYNNDSSGSCTHQRFIHRVVCVCETGVCR